MTQFAFVPLPMALPYWPSDLISPPPFLDEIGLRDFDVTEGTNAFAVTGTLLWLRELAFDLPGVDGLSLAFLSDGDMTAVPFELDVRPELALRLPSLSAAIRFQTDLLRPVQRQGTKWVPLVDAAGAPKPAEVRLEGIGISADASGDFAITLPAGAPTLGLGAVALGDTGIVLEIDGVTPHFSSTQAPPPGAPPNFRGLAIDEVKLHLPPDLDVPLLPADLTFEHLVIGTGGFSGTIRGEWTPTFDTTTKEFTGNGSGSLFGIPFALRELSLTFTQNVPSATRFVGELLLPFFDTPIAVELSLGVDGSFAIGIASTSGILTLEKEGVIRLAVESLRFALEAGVFSVAISGSVTPLALGDNAPTFSVRELSIDSKGRVKIAGGWLTLPKQLALDFHGFKLEITKIGFGSLDDGRRWIGLSGGLKLVEGLPAGASVEGLRIAWDDALLQTDPARAFSISLRGVGIEFEVPNAVKFKGAISFGEPTETEVFDSNGTSLGTEIVQRFDGEITLDITCVGLRIDAVLVVGSASGARGNYSFFAIYLSVQLPCGIPLGSTGVGLYGMAGLFALAMEPNRRRDEKWYGTGPTDGWYKRDGRVGVSDLKTKWDPNPAAIALGAGITLGTQSDNGYTIAASLLFVLVLPGPILMLEGKANLLTERAKLVDEPLFRMLVVLDGRAGTLTAGLDIHYRNDKGGEMLDISGGVEAFFDFHDPDAWHLYLGEREPRERRIRANIFQLFTAEAYFMIDSHALQTGAWVGFDKKWAFGPVQVTLEAWLEGNAHLSFKPQQFHGDIWLHGHLGASVFGFGFQLLADARCDADVWKPFHLLFSLDLALDLPFPFPDFKFNRSFEYGPVPDPPPLPLPLQDVAVEHLKVTTKWPLPRGLRLPDYDPNRDGFLDPPTGPLEPDPITIPVVPLDARPVLTFARPVDDVARVGSTQAITDWEWIGDPARGEGSARAQYRLVRVALERRTSATWTVVAAAPAAAPTPTLYGSWAPVPSTNSTPAQTKLWLWSRSPFDFTRQTTRAWDEWVTQRYPLYPCLPPPPPRRVCVGFTGIDPDAQLSSPWSPPAYPEIVLTWSPTVTGTITATPPLDGRDRALCFSGPAGLQIKLPLGGTVTKLTTVPHTDGGDGNTDCLLEICVELPPDPTELIRREQLTAHLVSELSRWSHEGAVLDPDTTYRLRIETAIEVRDWAWEAPPFGIPPVPYNGVRTQIEYAYFRTEGPPGLTQLSPPRDAAPDLDFASGLDDLTPYVVQTLPPTVPPPGEPPRLPRPVYRAYDVGVRFNEDYVERLYRASRRDLALYLYDPNDQPVRNPDSSLLSLANRWGVAETRTLTASERDWIQTVNKSTCAQLSESSLPRDRTLTTAGTTVLAPDTVYEARLVPLLLHEDFSTALTGWTPVDLGGPSQWTAASGAVVQTATLAASGTMLVRGDAWTSVRLSAVVRRTGTSAIGAVVRTSAASGYRLVLDASGRRLERLSAGTVTVLAADTTGLAADGDHELSFEASGPHLRVHLDGAPVFDLEDTTHAAGAIGLWAAGPARFSDVRVDDLRGRAAPIVYRFAFATSSYATFFDHLHSFQDELWHASLDVAPHAARAVAPAAALTEQEWRDHDALATAALGPAAVQPPTRVEVTRLGASGLLLRSPEPLDWSRTSISLLHAPTPLPTPIAPAELKLTAGADPSISLLLREPCNLTGYHLEHRTWPAALAADPGAPRFTDDPDLWLPAGTDVRLAGELSWSDAIFVLRLSSPTGGPLGAVVGYEDATHHVRFVMDKAGRRLVRRDGTTTTTLWQDDVRYAADRTYELALVVQGAAIRGFLDGIPVFSHTPKEPRIRGRFGLYAPPATQARFSHVAGYANTDAFVPATPTSDLKHDGWSLRLGAPDTDLRATARLSSPEPTVLGLVTRYTDAANYYRLELDAIASRRRLIRRTANTETVLWESTSSSTPGRDHLLTLDADGDLLRGYLDGVPLFTLTDATHPHGRAGSITRSGGVSLDVRVAAPVWLPYHTFTDEPPRPSGTRVPVLGRPLLPTPTLRVRSPDNRIVHARAFLDDTAYTPIPIRVLRRADPTHRADGTGVAIFPDSLPAGSYRLRLDYHPTGHAPEIVSLDLPWR